MLPFLYISVGHGGPASGWVGVGVAIALTLAIMVGVAGQTKLEISSNNRRYRIYLELLGLHIGRWRPLPPVVGVTLKIFSTYSQSDSKYNWQPVGNRITELVVLLSLRNSPTGLIIGRYDSDELEAAQTTAKVAAARFGVPVREYLMPQRTGRR